MQKFLDIKNQKKQSSIDSVILPTILDLIKYNGAEIKFKKLTSSIRILVKIIIKNRLLQHSIQRILVNHS